MSTKKIFNLLLLTALIVPTVGRAVKFFNIPAGAKFVFGLAVTALCKNMVKKGREEHSKGAFLSSFCTSIGINQTDLSNVVGFTGVLSSFAVVANKKIGNECKRFAFQAPLSIAVSYLVTRRPVRSFFCEIPGIGDYLGCSNYKSDTKRVDGDCKGICQSCFLTNSILFLGTFTGTGKLIASCFKETVESDSQDEDDDDDDDLRYERRRKDRRSRAGENDDDDPEENDDEFSNKNRKRAKVGEQPKPGSIDVLNRSD